MPPSAPVLISLGWQDERDAALRERDAAWKERDSLALQLEGIEEDQTADICWALDAASEAQKSDEQTEAFEAQLEELRAELGVAAPRTDFRRANSAPVADE